MMTTIRIILSMLLCSLLLSCSKFFPHHATPNIGYPTSTRTGVKYVESDCDLRTVMWWKKMHDPTLNHLIKKALDNNNEIKAASANILQAQAKFRQALFSWLPTLNISGNGFLGGGWDTQVSPQGNLAKSGILSKTGTSHFHGYYAGFMPSYSLNVLQNINNVKFARAALVMQRASYYSTRLTVISQVSGGYFMLLGQKEQRREQIQLIRDLKEVRRLEWVRYQDGASDLSTVTNLDQQIADNEANLSSIENSIAQNENAIQLLLNRNPRTLNIHRSIHQLSVKGLVPGSLSSAVLKHRPDVIMAQENLKMSLASLGLAYANFFPAITITSVLGGASAELAHLLSISTALWVINGAASMPILNGNLYEQISASKAGYMAACYSYVQTMRSVFADVDNQLTNQQKMNEIYSNKSKALHAAQKNYTLVLARYDVGAKDYRDVANAKVTVDSARLDLNQAKMQQLDSIVNVYQALAGGYEGNSSCITLKNKQN